MIKHAHKTKYKASECLKNNKNSKQAMNIFWENTLCALTDGGSLILVVKRRSYQQVYRAGRLLEAVQQMFLSASLSSWSALRSGSTDVPIGKSIELVSS